MNPRIVISAIVLIVITIAVVALIFYFMVRGDKVDSFLDDIYRDCLYRYRNGNSDVKDEAERILHKHLYAELLFSFKPLKRTKWYTTDEIEFMNMIKFVAKKQKWNTTFSASEGYIPTYNGACSEPEKCKKGE